MGDASELQFFEKLEPPPETEEPTPVSGGYFSNIIGQIFRSDGSPQPNGVVPPTEERQNLERTESGESRTSEESGFQRSLTDKFTGLLKSKVNPQLKDYNDSNFKQYWMPDSTGRECYQCEERFTTFRRRHHCRLCGQIFCAKCCSSHIDGAALGYMGELRLCDYCARKVQRLAEEGKQTPTTSTTRSQTPVNSRKISFDRNTAHKNSDTVRTVSNGAIWSLCPPESSMPPEITSPPQLGSRRNSLAQSSNGPGVPTILSVADLCASNSAMLTNSHSHPMITEEEESGPDWFRTMHPGMDGVINNETSDSADVFAYANLAGAITNEFTEMMDARAAEPTSATTDRKITFPSLSLDESVMNAAKEEQRDNLEELFRRNTERILDEVMKREYIREDKWRDLILKSVYEVVENVTVNVPSGDTMNIADYVHVKKVHKKEGKVDSEIIWGVACSRSLVYKSLSEEDESSHTTESIMIVSGSIEYERVSNKLSSIEPIIVQEEKFLEKQIDRIATKRASLILVEGGVSHIAAQLLHKRGIKVAVNVKMSILQRISRATGADIVSNSDSQLVEQNLGCCPEFQQRNMQQEDGRIKTLMIFADCQKETGCTVLLHGDDLKELVAVKRVVQFLVTIVYSNYLEQSYLNAFNTTIARRQSDCVVCEKRRAIVYSQGEKTEFEKNLYATMLSSSPVIEFEPPLLETATGRECPLIAYFKQPLYKLLKPGDVELIKQGYEEDIVPIPKKEPLLVDRRHAFAQCNRGAILDNVARSFRLFGGINFRRRTAQIVKHRKIVETEKQPFRAKDVLDPRVHQTLAVLFGSFSRKSPNAPYFCVRPWVVSMQYYKDHDMTIGEFLVKFCFNRSYECPSSNCEVPMLDHSRKLVYGKVCVEISTQTVNEAENAIESEQQKSIMTWRNCGKCNCSSQMVKFDKAIWHLSFAKFLEYIGNSCFTTDTIYPITNQNQCSHCFFHEKLYFFAMDNLVTTFKVIAIRPYSVVFSPIICSVKVLKVSRKELSDDVSRIATLALTACEDTNKQLAELDEEVQITPIVVKLAGAIRNTMALASESRMFAKNILSGDEDLIRSNDRLYREVTGTFMKVREVTYNLIALWNENCAAIKYPKRTPEDIQEIATLQKLENPFPSHLHLAIKLQPRLGVVVRDIQDTRGNFKPDIGSIIAYALSAVDYNKIPEAADTVSMDSASSSLKFSQMDDGENLASSQHLEVEFEDESASYYVKMLYAEKFRKLRELLIAEGEETFIRSLSNSTFWTPQGGKSGSFFYRTQDDRFVVKQMSRFEIQSFVKFAPNYFDYLTTSATESKLTTLCKVYGVFRIGYKSKTTTLKVDILVMEYLFYNHNVSQVWDLKGSLRNRLASTGKSANEMVLLDENFVKDLWNQQLYVLPHSKAAMNQAISNDSHFLSSQYIMDYSLLVGVDDDNGELILGIVDYMRTYTLDKKLESWVKIVAIPGAHLPTILSPEMYCARFSEAIDSYFPVVPDQWTGLGSIRSY
ncbi:1-phosphatidylinositol-3-phosphate 5-kinase [Caenorhabditis elegans]|uniref:1-phosphatidylinositol-3-phosphate 5-kinase n=1 Tax=Caenorhabditis elegans TaxID=6239 RepID=G5ED98_CAEEL|nr:1-phosphatidylinositol-3-phosphate 5-kinase [Caenorhabditis elegans]CAA19436.3 1-phosphatidylinositol-3-phosphate 5-kinase [Caenorhabditis elegans]|eukprot:NP_510155.3 PIP Kinase [Caenorhabditis elegans]